MRPGNCTQSIQEYLIYQFGKSGEIGADLITHYVNNVIWRNIVLQPRRSVDNRGYLSPKNPPNAPHVADAPTLVFCEGVLPVGLIVNRGWLCWRSWCKIGVVSCFKGHFWARIRRGAANAGRWAACRIRDINFMFNKT